VTVLAVFALSALGCNHSNATSARKAAPLVGTDLGLAETARWQSPVLSNDANGDFLAQLAPVRAPKNTQRLRPVALRLSGIGYPGRGTAAGRPYVGPGVDTRFTQQNGQYDVSVGFSGVRLSLLVWSTGGDWRARVDGKYLTSPVSAGSAFAFHTLDLDFSKAGGARARVIEFELAGGAWLAGLDVGRQGDRVWLPARPGAGSAHVYWLGDSYVAGGGAAVPGFDDLTHVASARAGLSDVTVDALGGTGYVKANASAGFPNYLARAEMNLRSDKARPDLIVVGGSINDAGFSLQQVRDAASALYAYLARALPRARVIVVTFTSEYPVPPPIETANTGVLDAARAAPNVLGALDLPAQVLALRGNQGAASLNAELTSTTTMYHPSPAGHELYGQLIGAFIGQRLKLGR
jgi:lysophospholipase L1-like esterase